MSTCDGPGKRWLAGAAITLALLTGGCASPGVVDGQARDTPMDAQTSPMDAQVSPMNLQVWPSDSTKMVARIVDPHPFAYFPPGSNCDGRDSYALTVADRQLSWEICRIQTPAYRLEQGQRTLSTAEFNELVQALRNLRAATEGLPCPTEAAELGLEVTTPRGVTLYRHGSYSCSPTPFIHIEYLNVVFDMLRQLVP
jgi:hypothetical protein